MNDNLDIWVKISSQIGELNASVRSVLDKLTNHEQRLTNLETKKAEGWKTQLLMLLAKAIVIGGVCIASLAGAGGVLSKMIGM